MSDEEKEAIHWLENTSLDPLEYKKDINAIEDVLNLIKKQSKEIEKLKYDKKFYQAVIDEVNKKWEDKIKAKIEEYKKERYIAGEHLVVEVLESLLKEGE